MSFLSPVHCLLSIWLSLGLVIRPSSGYMYKPEQGGGGGPATLQVSLDSWLLLPDKQASWRCFTYGLSLSCKGKQLGREGKIDSLAATQDWG